MSFSEPWYLTVVCTQGIQFVRPEKSWKPIVSVTVVEHDRTYETILGCDGRNPNLRAPIELRDVHHASRLDIKVWHRSQTKKSRRKRYLVGSAYVTLGDIVRKQSNPGSNISLTLKLPPMQKRCSTLGNAKQTGCATVTVRLRESTPPEPQPRTPPWISPSSTFSEDEAGPSRSLTMVSSVPASEDEDETVADIPTISVEPPTELRKRRARKSGKKKIDLQPYWVNTSDEDRRSHHGSSSEDESCISDYEAPTTPRDEEVPLLDEATFDEIAGITFGSPYTSSTLLDARIAEAEDWCGDHVVPLTTTQRLSRTELILDSFSPYRELSHPQCDFAKILGRLLTEWYAVGASLLAEAALNAAVFGYSSGTLFEMDGIALRSVTVGSIAAGIGLVIDAWFLVLYSSGDIERFQRLASDISSMNSPNNPTYLYFSLTCRLPTFLLFVSSFSLMLFLLTVAWAAWPSAVLVMCGGCGVLLTLQYLVYGVRGVARGLGWCTRVVRKLFSLGKKRATQHNPQVAEADRGSQTPPPPPYSSPRPAPARISAQEDEVKHNINEDCDASQEERETRHSSRQASSFSSDIGLPPSLGRTHHTRET